MKSLLLIFTLLIFLSPVLGYTYDENGNFIPSETTQSVITHIHRQHFALFYALDDNDWEWAMAYRLRKWNKLSFEGLYSTKLFGFSIEYDLLTLGDLGLIVTNTWTIKELDQTFGIGLRFYRFKF